MPLRAATRVALALSGPQALLCNRRRVESRVLASEGGVEGVGVRVARAMTTTCGADLMCLMFMTVYLVRCSVHARPACLSNQVDVSVKQMCACGMCCGCCYAFCMPFLTTTNVKNRVPGLTPRPPEPGNPAPPAARPLSYSPCAAVHSTNTPLRSPRTAVTRTCKREHTTQRTPWHSTATHQRGDTVPQARSRHTAPATMQQWYVVPARVHEEPELCSGAQASHTKLSGHAACLSR